MLKTSAGKLYTLLTACKPGNAKVKKRLLITEILEMPEYKALQVYQGTASAMDDYYSPAKLQEATYEQVLEVKKIIPFLEECIRKLYELICYGDVRMLCKLKKISFYDSTSMKKLHTLVTGMKNTGINITNVPEYDVWSIFSEDAILSLDSKLDLFDADDMDTLEAQVTEKLKDNVYCISAKEIAEKRKSCRDIYRKEETVRIRLQIVENKTFVKKLIWSFISIVMVMSQFAGSAVYFTAFGRISVLVIYFIVLIAYWILG
jgi:hypothetical protein